MIRMPKFLWVEACSTTVYVQNKIPHRVLGKITPESVFTGKNPEVSHFRIFGSSAYCHIPEEKRKKLDQTAKKGYLVGYVDFVASKSVPSLKLCREAWTTAFQRTQKKLVEIPLGSRLIKIINYFNGDPKSKLKEIGRAHV